MLITKAPIKPIPVPMLKIIVDTVLLWLENRLQIRATSEDIPKIKSMVIKNL